jgi:hypothetical protein
MLAIKILLELEVIMNYSIKFTCLLIFLLLAVGLTPRVQAMDASAVSTGNNGLTEEEAIRQALELSKQTTEVATSTAAGGADEIDSAVLQDSWDALSTPQKLQDPWKCDFAVPYPACDARYQDTDEFGLTGFRSVTIRQLPVLYQGYRDLPYSEQNLCGYYALWNATIATSSIVEGQRIAAGRYDLEKCLRTGLNDRGTFEASVLKPASARISRYRTQEYPAMKDAIGSTYADLTPAELELIIREHQAYLSPEIAYLSPEIMDSIIIIDDDGITAKKNELIQTRCQALLQGDIHAIPFIIATDDNRHWISAVLAKTPGHQMFNLYVFDSLAQPRTSDPMILRLVKIANKTPGAELLSVEIPHRATTSRCQNIAWALLAGLIATAATAAYYVL